MKLRPSSIPAKIVVLGLILLPGLPQIFGQALTNGLVAYWPLDKIEGSKTPDVVSGYDMEARNLTTADVVTGVRSNAFSFANARQTLLSRVHSAGEGLPINQHPAFTISLWVKATGPGQTDLRIFSEANTATSDPLFNLGTHNTGASGQLDLLIRQGGSTQVGHLLTTAEPFDDAWHQIVFLQQADGTRTIYIDGVADDLVIGAKVPTFNYNFNDTTIGGILRASPSHWITGLIDEVAVWKRALTEAEINDVRQNGVPTVTTAVLPLEIKSFTAEFPAVTQGDRVALKWDASKDATLAISPGIADVTGISQAGVGSTSVVVNAATTFQLVATRGSESVTSQVQVATVTGVAPGWHLIDNFNIRPAGAIRGNWLNPEGSVVVQDLGVNKVLAYEEGNDLAAVPLNSLAITEGQKGTLFFRMYVAPEDTTSILGATFGLTDRPIRFNGDFNGNVGPYVRLERLFDGGTLDLSAHNGVGAAYDVVPDAIQPANVYKVWIDFENKPFDVLDGVQNGGDVFSVHLQKEGDANRTTLFQDYVADRDAINIDPALGAPGPNLTYLYLAAIGATQGTNVLFDDFYLSQGAFNATTPVPASSFVKMDPPATVTITSVTRGANSIALQWTAKAGAVYTVLKKASLSDAWAPLATGFPTGGATGASVSFTDNAATGSAGFYLISQAP